jgi:AraC-like DNA-binding protein
MEAAARYVEHPPHPALADLVEAVWSVTSGEAVGHRVLPDGCIDVLVRDGGPPVVVGPATRVTVAPMQPGTAVHGLRFRPGAAPFALGVGADELRDLVVPLGDVLGAAVVRRDRAGTLAPHAAAATATGTLQRLLAVHARRPTDPLVDAAVARLGAAPGTPIAALAGELAVSPRQLRRRFDSAVGYGPKRLARVLRLQRLLALAQRTPGALGVDLAFAAGYADEAHMGREARELAGIAAQALLRERGRSVQAPDRAVGDAA